MSIRTKRNSRRFIAAAAAVAVAASTFAFSPSASAVGVPLDTMKPSSSRFAGTDRFFTAASIAQKVARDGEFAAACEVAIVNGNSFADGLAASSLTAENGGVILLSQANSLPGITVSTIESLADFYCTGTENLVAISIVGGRAVISETVADALRAHPNVSSVTRYAGANRYTTSLAVAEAVRGGACPVDFPETAFSDESVIIATGRDFPDALAAGPLAYFLCAPIVLHDGDVPSQEMKIFLEGYKPNQAFIVGGTAAVPAAIESALVSVGLGVTRLAGVNRFETAVAIADYMKSMMCDEGKCDEDSYPYYAEGLILANGRNFPDALAAAALSVTDDGTLAPILLTETNSIPAATAAWHVANSDTLQRVWVVGGPAAVSNAVLNGAVGAATAVRPVVTSATTANTPNQAQINLAGVVSLSATSALPGAMGNDWEIFLTQQPAGEVPDVLIDTTAKTINVLHNFNSLTFAQFRDLWNARGANAYFTATAIDGSFTTGATGDDPYTAVANGEPGGTVVTITLTYSRTVTTSALATTSVSAAVPFNLFTGTSVTDSLLLDLSDLVAVPTAVVKGGKLVVEYQYNTAKSKYVPVIGETSIRIVPGAVRLDATPYSTQKLAVTSPSQQLVLTTAS